MKIQNIRSYRPQKIYQTKRNVAVYQPSFKGEYEPNPATSDCFIKRFLSNLNIKKRRKPTPEDIKDREIKDFFRTMDDEIKTVKKCGKIYKKVIKQELQEGKKKDFKGYVPFETMEDKT